MTLQIRVTVEKSSITLKDVSVSQTETQEITLPRNRFFAGITQSSLSCLWHYIKPYYEALTIDLALQDSCCIQTFEYS